MRSRPTDDGTWPYSSDTQFNDFFMFSAQLLSLYCAFQFQSVRVSSEMCHYLPQWDQVTKHNIPA